MIVQALADGIFTGAIISLGAIGLSLTLQIMRFANFAHAEFMTIGAYLALAVVTFIGPGTPTLGLSFGWCFARCGAAAPPLWCWCSPPLARRWCCATSWC